VALFAAAGRGEVKAIGDYPRRVSDWELGVRLHLFGPPPIGPDFIQPSVRGSLPRRQGRGAGSRLAEMRSPLLANSEADAGIASSPVVKQS